MYYIPKYICDVNMDIFSSDVKYVGNASFTYQYHQLSKKLSLVIKHTCSFFFSKRKLIIFGKKQCQRNHVPCVTCYSYVHNGHRFLSTFDSIEFHSINVLKFMQCILSELIGGNSSANIVVKGSSLFGDFVIL